MKPDPAPGPDQQSKAIKQVAEAHSLLTALRQKMDAHPDLEEAIRKLEMALSVLTIESGGLL